MPLCLESEVGEYFKHINLNDVKELLRTATKKGHPFSVQWIPTENRVGLSFQKDVSSKSVALKKILGFATSKNIPSRSLSAAWTKYFIVDFAPASDPRLVFTTAGILKFQKLLERIGRMAVIVSTLPTVSSCHKDGNDALAIVLAGSKTFRVRTDGGSGGYHPFTARQGGRVDECPSGWTDVCMQPGDALYVPKGEWHSVASLQPSILLSLTLMKMDDLVKDDFVANESIFGAADSSKTSRSDSSDSSLDFHGRDLFATPTGPLSALSQMTSKWRFEGMPMVLGIERACEVESALIQVRKLMFDVANMTLLPQYGTDYVWGKLFGQKHIQEDYDDPRSGRVNTTLMDLSEHDVDLCEALKAAVLAITAQVTRTCRQNNPDVIVTVSSSSLLIRLRGRIPAQRIHVDGSFVNHGHGTELSCMAGLNDHHGVVFVDLVDGAVIRPHLKLGELLLFDHSGREHLGHSIICDNENELTAAVVFLTYHVRTSVEKILKVRHDRVDDSPDKFLRHDSKIPIVASCVVCESPVFRRDIMNLRLCRECDGHQDQLDSTSQVGVEVPLSVVCHVCVHTPARPHYETEIQTLSQMASTDATINFMLKSIICDCEMGAPHLRLCNHLETNWQAFVPAFSVLLFFQLSELKATACWLLILHLNNVLLTSYMLPVLANIETGNRLMHFAIWAGDMCLRRTKLIDLMLQYCGIHVLSGQAIPQSTLFCDTANDTFVRAIGERIERLARFISDPYTGIEELNHVFSGPIFSVHDLNLRCECSETRTRGGYVFCAPITREVTVEAPVNDLDAKRILREIDNVKVWLWRDHRVLYEHLVIAGLKPVM